MHFDPESQAFITTEDDRSAIGAPFFDDSWGMANAGTLFDAIEDAIRANNGEDILWKPDGPERDEMVVARNRKQSVLQSMLDVLIADIDFSAMSMSVGDFED